LVNGRWLLSWRPQRLLEASFDFIMAASLVARIQAQEARFAHEEAILAGLTHFGYCGVIAGRLKQLEQRLTGICRLYEELFQFMPAHGGDRVVVALHRRLGCLFYTLLDPDPAYVSELREANMADFIEYKRLRRVTFSDTVEFIPDIEVVIINTE
jgi:hypothetical protein